MKRYIVCMIAALSATAVIASSASAQLVVRPRYTIAAFGSHESCIKAPGFVGTNHPFTAGFLVKTIWANVICKHRTVTSEKSGELTEEAWGGYYPAKDPMRCFKKPRPFLLYLNGSLYERRELGEFQGMAYLTPWKNPHPNGYAELETTFPSGHWELRSPGFSYSARVYKGGDETKTYPAKIVCENLTLDLGSS